MSRRIWELDALRGLCILGMILVHLVYDIRELYGLADFAYPAIFSFVMQWGSVLFLLISGICVTLGHHPVRRGLAVFGCGMLCSLVTAGCTGWASRAGGSSFGLAFSTAWGYACFCGRGWGGYPIGYWGLWPCSFWRWAIGSGALRWPPPGSFPWA